VFNGVHDHHKNGLSAATATLVSRATSRRTECIDSFSILVTCSFLRCYWVR